MLVLKEYNETNGEYNGIKTCLSNRTTVRRLKLFKIVSDEILGDS